MKTCSKCGNDKPLDDFHRDSQKASGVRSRCKACAAGPARERSRRWHAANSERANEARRRRRMANIDEERRRDRERARTRRATDEWRDYQRQWRARNSDAVREIYERHRAKYPRWSRSRTDRETVAYLAVLADDPCGSCGTRESIEVDHIVPRCAGGSDHWTNLGALCRSCNASKNGKSLLLAMVDMHLFAAACAPPACG